MKQSTKQKLEALVKDFREEAGILSEVGETTASDTAMDIIGMIEQSIKEDEE